jgi:hypothetical protein
VSTPTPGARAVSSYEIADVFLVDSHCWVDREFNQTQQLAEFVYGHQARVDPECLMQTRTPLGGGAPVYILRYFIQGEVRLLKPGTEPAEGRDPSDKELFALLKFLFAADYHCPANALEDQDAVGAFGRNAFFHAWPYFREEVHAACSKLRIPRITLPMLKSDQTQSANASQDKST